MEYGRFISIAALIIIASLTIYVGCLRSYAIYFFERDAKRVVFLDPWTSAGVPIALSFMLIVSYLSAKRMKAVVDEIAAKKLEKSSQSSLYSSQCRKISRSSDLESIPEISNEHSSKPGESNMNSISESSESDKEDQQDSVEPQISRKPGTWNSDHLRVEEVENASESNRNEHESTDSDDEERSDVIFTLNRRESGKIYLDDLPPSRKASKIDSREIEVQRKQSQIYKQIGKISFMPFSMKDSFFRFKKPSLQRFHKESLFDILLQLLGVHLPLWLSVIAVHITLVEILNMKFYYQFYYHHPGMKLLAMFLSISIGLFHELKFTWVVNNILGIAAAFVIIARVQTVSYISGIIFLLGMVVFDLFWMYAIDLFSTVTKQSRAPLMVIIPWGNEGKSEMIATLDIIVPGIFLNIVLKFSDMYDSRAFLPSFYAVLFGFILTFVIAVRNAKSTPAIVIPAVLSALTSILSVERPLDLWRFEIKQ